MSIEIRQLRHVCTVADHGRVAAAGDPHNLDFMADGDGAFLPLITNYPYRNS